MADAMPQLRVFEPAPYDGASRGDDTGAGPPAARVGMPLVPGELPRPLESVARRAPGTTLQIAPDVLARWKALDAAVRERIVALFDRPCVIAARSFHVEGGLPEPFARDLERGGCGFRVAFPTLTRQVAAIVGSRAQISVRVVCRGTHVGSFFHLLTPTHRCVQFDVLHRLVVRDDEVLEDHIALDLRALVLQLATTASRRSGPSDVLAFADGR